MTETDRLSAIEQDVWNQLTRALVDRRSPLRWCTLATLSDTGPQQRTIVLRALERTDRELVFYTDRRTPKVAQIAASPQVSALFLNDKSMQQYRFTGRAELITSGAIWDSHWERLSAQGQRDYATLNVPGSPLTEDTISYDPALARQNFAVIVLKAQHLDWLSLSREGHLRAGYAYRSGGTEATWLTP